MKFLATVVFYLMLVLTNIRCSKDTIQTQAPSCRIVKIYSSGYSGTENIEATFSYTYWGAPHTIRIKNPSMEAPDHFFLYDSSKRLIGYMTGFEVYRNGVPDTAIWDYHRFIYQGDVIVGDTVFNMIDLHDRYRIDAYYHGKYQYDAAGRILKYEMINNHYPDVQYLYTYAYPENEDPYTDNRGLMGTHPVLMFTMRDYRRKVPALEYNQFGYPTRFSLNHTDSTYYKFDEFPPVREVVYECK